MGVLNRANCSVPLRKGSAGFQAALPGILPGRKTRRHFQTFLQPNATLPLTGWEAGQKRAGSPRSPFFP
jgi:hypothetical protein